MNTKIINQLSAYLDKHGKLKRDVNLNRNTLEIICCTLSLQKSDILESISSSEFDEVKYGPELKDFDEWFTSHKFDAASRRQVMYFNNKDFDTRLQCISTIQIIDDLMIVYQRSGDIIKMKTDHRFFAELKVKYFPNVSSMHIVYGSLHKETKVIGRRDDHN